MKILILGFILLLSHAAFSQTTDYHPLPEDDAIWNYHFTAWCGGPNSADDYYSVIVSGDTLINGLEYRKWRIPSIQSFTVGNCPSVETGYFGAFRQDIPAKKVYFVPPGFSDEQLLYDFNLMVGDTVNGYLQMSVQDPNLVVSLDTVMIGSEYRKRWLIHPGYNVYFIEGIGSTYGLVEPIPAANVVDLPDIEFLCFSQDGQTLYPDTLESCDVISSVHFSDEYQQQLEINPNPSSGSFTVRFPGAKFNQLILYDLAGRMVYQSSVKNKSIRTINEVPQGIFILIAIDEMGRKARQKVLSY